MEYQRTLDSESLLQMPRSVHEEEHAVGDEDFSSVRGTFSD